MFPGWVVPTEKRGMTPVHEHLARRVQDADVHRLGVIDPAMVPMLSVVESHSALLLRDMRMSLR